MSITLYYDLTYLIIILFCLFFISLSEMFWSRVNYPLHYFCIITLALKKLYYYIMCKFAGIAFGSTYNSIFHVVASCFRPSTSASSFWKIKCTALLHRVHIIVLVILIVIHLEIILTWKSISNLFTRSQCILHVLLHIHYIWISFIVTLHQK